jgi:hypothetical protein
MNDVRRGPAPNMCWCYTDASRTQGFRDASREPSPLTLPANR